LRGKSHAKWSGGEIKKKNKTPRGLLPARGKKGKRISYENILFREESEEAPKSTRVAELYRIRIMRMHRGHKTGRKAGGRRGSKFVGLKRNASRYHKAEPKRIKKIAHGGGDRRKKPKRKEDLLGGGGGMCKIREGKREK